MYCAGPVDLQLVVWWPCEAQCLLVKSRCIVMISTYTNAYLTHPYRDVFIERKKLATAER